MSAKNRVFTKEFKEGVAQRWHDSIYGEIRSMMQLEGFQAAHACEIARVSRAGFYRHYEEHEPRQADMGVRPFRRRPGHHCVLRHVIRSDFRFAGQRREQLHTL